MMRSQQRSRCVRDCVLVFVLVLAGCRGDELAAPTGESPRVASVAPRPNPANALAVFVDVQAEHADSVRVLFVEAGAAADTTPPVPLVAGRATVPVLGLRSGARYSAVTEVTGPGGVGRSDSLAFTGGELPELLRGVTITTTGAGSPGLNLTALSLGGAALFALAFDSTGSVRWYREFDDPRAGGELKQQPNGNFTIYIGASFGSQPVPGYYVEFSPTGDSLRAFTAPSPLYTDNHELWITGSGAGERIHLFGYDHRVTDITPFGGSADASLAGHSLVRLRPDGSTEFVWSAWDHLSLTDWIEPPFPGPVDPDEPDFDHPNALSFDRDSNYIVSWRNLGTITKLDAHTGAILWQLGGVHNQFTFVGDPLGGFSAQHYARILPDGHLLLYDNGERHQPAETRAAEYSLDTLAKTATLVWQYHHTPPIFTPFVGSAQRLGDGATLVGFGMAGVATEVGTDGTARWEATVQVNGAPAFMYRVLRIESLYGR
jgi:hypothetical protein